MPERIQRKRTKGFRLPPGCVYVGRPTIFGNPFTPEDYWNAGYGGSLQTAIKHCVDEYRRWLSGEDLLHDWRDPSHFMNWLENCRASRISKLEILRGKDLACWCPIISHGNYTPCHADVLLSIANDISIEEVISENTRRAKRETL